MAQNEISLKIHVDDAGSLSLIAGDATKAAGAVGKLSTATDGLNKHRNVGNKLEKGTAGITSNSTKAFSKQAQTIGGGLVPAYATLAANIFAITAAFGALREAAGLEQLEAGLINVGNAAGRNLPYIADNLREITGAAVSTQEAMTAVALGTSAGFSTAQLEGLTKVAKGASLALGRDMGDALSRLTRGAAKLEPEILDELGIMVRLDDATAAYATTLGKTSAQLTQTERRMAFTNAIIDQGTKKFGEIADAIDPNPYDQLAAAFNDLAKATLSLINTVFEPLISILAGNKGALTGAVVLFSTTISKQMVPALFNGAEAAATAAEDLGKLSTQQLKNLKSIDGTAKSYNKHLEVLKSGKATTAQLRNVTASLNLSHQAQLRELEALTKAGKTKSKEYQEREAKIQELIRAKNTLTSATINEAQADAKSVEAGAIASASRLEVGNVLQQLRHSYEANIDVYKAESKGIKGSTKLIKGLKLGFKQASISARVFGTALLSAIPIIGQVIFFGSILYDLLKDLFRKTESQKFADEFVKSLDSMDRIMDQLSTTLKNTSSETDKFSSSLTVAVGVLDQLATGFTKFDEAVDKELASKLKAIRQETEQIQDIDSSYEYFQNFGKEETAKAESSLTKLELRTKSLSKTIGEMRRAGLENNSQFSNLVALLALVESGAIKTTEAFDEVFNSIKKGQDDLNALVNSSSGLFTSLAKSFISITPKVVSPFDKALRSVQNVHKSIEDLSKFADSKIAIKKFFDSSSAIKGLNDMKKGLTAVNVKIKDLSDVQVVDEYVRALGSVSEGYTDIVAKVQKQKDLVSELKKISSNSAANTAKLIVAEKELNNLKALKLSLEKKGLLLTVGEEGASERLAQIQRELNALSEAGNHTVSERLRILKAIQGAQNISNQLAQAGFSIRSREIENLRTKISLTEKNATLEAKANALNADPRRDDKLTLSAKEAAEIQDKTRADRLKLIEQERKLAIDKANLEADSAKIQLDILKATAELYNIKIPKSLEKASAAIDANRKDTIANINAGAETQKNTAKQEVGIGNEEQIRAVVEALGEGEDTYNRILNLIKNNEGNLDLGHSIATGIEAAQNAIAPMEDSLRALGPEGELVAAVSSGALAIADAWNNVGLTLDSNASKMEKSAAIANAIGQTFSQLGSIMGAASDARIAGIDSEIAAEQKRDGKSKASLAKISALEKKKEAEKKKAFETDKKMKMAQTVASTAAAVMQTLATGGYFAIPLAAIIGAMGAAQLAVIAGTSFQGGGSASASSIPTSVSMGERSNSVDLARATNAPGEQAFIRGERGIGSGATNFQPAFTGTTHRAVGGATTGFMVGEQGPELFIPNTPGVIKPADETANQTQAPNINFSINAIDSKSVEDMLLANRGTIIRNIREAANQHGDTFLEAVREDSLT